MKLQAQILRLVSSGLGRSVSTESSMPLTLIPTPNASAREKSIIYPTLAHQIGKQLRALHYSTDRLPISCSVHLQVCLCTHDRAELPSRCGRPSSVVSRPLTRFLGNQRIGPWDVYGKLPIQNISTFLFVLCF